MEFAKKIIKRLSLKAAGPDGLSNELLKNLPSKGIRELIHMLREVELSRQLPQQLTTSLLVMIPKNERTPPLAPQIAKVYLHEALQKFTQLHPDIKVDVWIDDISFDVLEDCAATAARKALQAIRDLKSLLEEDELLLSIEILRRLASLSTT